MAPFAGLKNFAAVQQQMWNTATADQSLIDEDDLQKQISMMETHVHRFKAKT